MKKSRVQNVLNMAKGDAKRLRKSLIKDSAKQEMEEFYQAQLDVPEIHIRSPEHWSIEYSNFRIDIWPLGKKYHYLGRKEKRGSYENLTEFLSKVHQWNKDLTKK